MHQCRVYLDNDFYCSSDMNTKSLFFALFFIEKQRKTYNALGEMRGIFLSKSCHNRIHIHSGCFGSTFLCVSFLLHSVRLSLSFSYLLLE